ncbi:MAG: hypothetical protein H0Z35_10065 [Thermoanaerobacteraceae bacterium]|nr:hypothetical protein [Thermoanaerobacteraceae bacterium]
MNAITFPVGFKLALELRGFEMGPPVQPLSHSEKFNLVNVRSRIEKIMGALLGDYKVEVEQLVS